MMNIDIANQIPDSAMKQNKTKMCNLCGAAEAETTNRRDNRNNNRQQQ